MTHYSQRPLHRLPRATALRLIDQLTAPDQRFARCFARYWQSVAKLDAAAVTRATRDELTKTATMLRASLGDVRFQTIGVMHDVGYEPVGLYAVRPLEDHPVGRVIATSLAAGGAKQGLRRGIVHALAIRDDHGGLAALRTAFLHIARDAEAQGFDVLYFYSSDHRLAGVYRRFGMEFCDAPALDSGHLVGRYDLFTQAHVVRMCDLEASLGMSELPVAA